MTAASTEWLTLTEEPPTMASEVRQELSQLMNSTGSHKDLAAKYVPNKAVAIDVCVFVWDVHVLFSIGSYSIELAS